MFFPGTSSVYEVSYLAVSFFFFCYLNGEDEYMLYSGIMSASILAELATITIPLLRLKCPCHLVGYYFINVVFVERCIHSSPIYNLGRTCQSWKEFACRSCQSLHCETLLFISRLWILVSNYGISTWWRHDDFAHKRGDFDWNCCQILYCSKCFGNRIYS